MREKVIEDKNPDMENKKEIFAENETTHQFHFSLNNDIGHYNGYCMARYT